MKIKHSEIKLAAPIMPEDLHLSGTLKLSSIPASDVLQAKSIIPGLGL